MIKLSIITINYNDATGLKKTLDSVASQTYPNIQHIIVDGGSTDESVEILREYAANQCKVESVECKGTENIGADESNNDSTQLYTTLHNSTLQHDSTPIYTTLHNSTPPKHNVLWVSEPDKGIYNAMNKGIEIALGKRIVNDDHTSSPIANGQSPIAQTDYIQILNAGDVLAAPNVTERMVVALQQCNTTANTVSDLQQAERAIYSENSERSTASKTSDLQNWIPIFYGNMIKEWPDGRRVKDTCGGGYYTPESFYYFYRGTLNHDCAYIRRDLFEKYGLYNEEMNICSDWEWYVRAIVLGGEKTAYTNIDVTVFDMTGISESNGKNKDLIQKERREYLESILPPSILRDYDMYSLPIEQYRRLKKYYLWGIVYFVERVLFKLEKWFKR